MSGKGKREKMNLLGNVKRIARLFTGDTLCDDKDNGADDITNLFTGDCQSEIALSILQPHS